MKYETDLIPLNPSPLPIGPYLIFAPHPDDETFGMGGTILLAAKAGISVSVVVMTNGEKGGNARIRIDEFNHAASILGIKDSIYLDLIDRQIHDSGGFKEEFNEIIKQINPKCIFSPSLLEFHPDHRAATGYVLKYLKERNLDCRFWLYEITRQAEVNHLIDITSEIENKKKAIRAYKSQLSQKDYEDIMLALNRTRAYTLSQDTKYAEGFWEIGKGQRRLNSFRSQIDLYLKGI